MMDKGLRIKDKEAKIMDYELGIKDDGMAKMEKGKAKVKGFFCFFVFCLRFLGFSDSRVLRSRSWFSIFYFPFSIIRFCSCALVRQRRISLWLILFTVYCSLFTFPAQAQEKVVEIESDVLLIESELSADDIQVNKEPAFDIETEILPADGGVLLEDQIRQEILTKELLKAEEAAVRVKTIREEEVIKINKSLRRVIEQNRRLQDEKKKMSAELGGLRGESRIESFRRESLENRLTEYQDRIKRAVTAQRDLDKTIVDLQTKIKAREDVLLARINDLQIQLEGGVQEGVEGAATAMMDVDGNIVQVQEEGLDVIALLDDLNFMQQQMKEDEAKVYYNMGNIFFHQGKFDEAINEYKKVLEIVPSDVNAHFNLAYVAGDFLHDFTTAIEHYQKYLYLNPAAEDAPLVEEKLLEAQLYMRSWQDKNVDREVQGSRPHKLYNW